MHELINENQTAEERRWKYGYCRELDLNPAWARRCRDWRWTNIDRHFQRRYDNAKKFQGMGKA